MATQRKDNDSVRWGEVGPRSYFAHDLAWSTRVFQERRRRPAKGMISLYVVKGEGASLFLRAEIDGLTRGAACDALPEKPRARPNQEVRFLRRLEDAREAA